MSDYRGTWRDEPGYVPGPPAQGETLWDGETGLAPGWAWRYGEHSDERGYRDIVFYRVKP